MKDGSYLAEKALRQGVSKAIKLEEPMEVASMLQSLCYEVEDGKFTAQVKWNETDSEEK